MSDTDVKAIQRRRGTSAEFDGFTSGLEGEITVNTTNNSVVVSDGKMNNYEAARADMTNVDQFDIMKRGIADNNLSNVIYDYQLDSAGAVKQIRKNADQIKIQLTAAYIADKDLSNVPLQIILNKGIAKSTLYNVPFSAVSWNEGDKERLGGIEQADITGGGLIFRNLDNAKVETFNNFPTDELAITGGGVAYKTLSNVGSLAATVKTQMGVASIDLSNVSDDTLYNKGGHRKYLLQRDLNNIDGANVDPNKLTSAGIARTNLANINFGGDDNLRESVLRTMGACNYNLDHVSLSVFTDTFHLMKDDGTNAVKDKVFKGVKNIIVNGDFKEKHSSFSDVSFNENELADNGDTYYAEWVSLEDGSRISVSNGLAHIKGTFGQCIGWDDEFKSLDKLYFSCDMESTTGIAVSLRQPSANGWISIAASSVNENEGSDYNRKGCSLAIDHSKLLNKVPLMLVIFCEDGYIKQCQLEKINITNFMTTPSNYSKVLSGEDSGRSCFLQIYDKLPKAVDEYYKLKPLFTSDGASATNPVYYYSLKSNGYVSGTGTKKYAKYGEPIYHFNGDNFELYNYAATQEFELVGVNVTEFLSKHKNGDLFYSEEDKKIYTFANDGFYFMYDTEPYRGLLYIDGRYSNHSVYLWNDVKRDFETVTSNGTGNGGIPLFAHILSDRKLEKLGWAESDSFSAQSATLYRDAYKYLVNQLHPVGSVLAGGRTDDSYNAASDPTWFIEWTDNCFENTSISLSYSLDQARTAFINYCNAKGYDIDGAVRGQDPSSGLIVIIDVFENPEAPESERIRKNLYDFVIRKELEPIVSNSITYYKTYDGLNIVPETDESKSAVVNSYEATGNGWFYLLHETELEDKELLTDAYFRLPRMKGVPVSFNGDDVSLGDSYEENVKFNKDTTTPFALVKHRMYFYMGVPCLKREEVAVNSLFSAISQIDNKIDKSVHEVKGVEAYEESEDVDCILKLSQNTHEFIWKPSKHNAILLVDLTDILGDKEYDSVEKTYPVSVYNEFTKFEFKLIVDKSFVTGHDKKSSRYSVMYLIKNDYRASGRPAITPTIGYDAYLNDDTSSTDTVTNISMTYNDDEMISTYTVYSNVRSGFNYNTTPYYRGMFVFESMLYSIANLMSTYDTKIANLNTSVSGLNTTVSSLSTTVTNNNNNAVHKTGAETISGAKTFTAMPVVKNTNIASNSAATIQDNEQNSVVYFKANDDSALGAVFHSLYKNGSTDLYRMLLGCYRKFGATQKATYAGLTLDSNGLGRFVVPDDQNGLPISENSTAAASTHWVRNYLSSLIPVGTIFIWPTSTAPAGFLLCDGGPVSRTTYKPLFDVIGTTYGSGNGSSTFNLPNFKGRYLKQGTPGTYGSESLPNITGNFGYVKAPYTYFAEGAFGITSHSNESDGTVASTWGPTIYNFDASRSSSTYKNDAKVNPDNAEILYIIKY